MTAANNNDDAVPPESAATRPAEGIGTDPATRLPPILGGYRLGELLGRGGMASVHRAEQMSLGRAVALKVIGPPHTHDQTFCERFLREARLAAGVNHPNIITVYDAGQDRGFLYMALELVGGDAAKATTADGGRLDERRALRVAIDCCHGLIALAHAGLIHRDIKPANIFLTQGPGGERAKLADLGLARRQDDPSMTAEGSAMGTPAYMSPEQAQGASTIDLRTDIYALGATLFTLLTGEPPFSGTTVYSVVAKVIQQRAPDPRQVQPAISNASASIVLHCLHKEPQARYATPQALLEDLEAALAGMTLAHAPLVPHPSASWDRVTSMGPVPKQALRQRSTVPNDEVGSAERDDREARTRRDRDDEEPLGRNGLWWIFGGVGIGMLVVGLVTFMGRSTPVAPGTTAEADLSQIERGLDDPLRPRPAQMGPDQLAALPTDPARSRPAPTPIPIPPTAQPAPMAPARPQPIPAAEPVPVPAPVFPAPLPAQTAPTAIPPVSTPVHIPDVAPVQTPAVARPEPTPAPRPAPQAVPSPIAIPAPVPLPEENEDPVVAQDPAVHPAPWTPVELPESAPVHAAPPTTAIIAVPLPVPLSIPTAAPTPVPPAPTSPGAISDNDLAVVRAGTAARQASLERSGFRCRMDVLANGLLAVTVLDRGITSLVPLQGLPIAQLDIENCEKLTGDLGALTGMPLTELRLAGCKRLSSLRGLRGVKLQRLTIAGCGELEGDFSLIKGSTLTQLDLSGCQKLTSLDGLQGQPLTEVNANGCESLTSLAGLRGCPLRSLSVRDGKRIGGDLRALSDAPLERLDLRNCGRLASLDGLPSAKLRALDIRDCSGIISLAPLRGAQLTTLDCSGNSSLTSLEGLQGMPLTELRLYGCRNLEGDFRIVRGAPLTLVDVSYCVRLNSLDGLQDSPLRKIIMTRTSTALDTVVLAGIRGLDISR